MKEQDVGVKWFNTVFYPQRKAARAVHYEESILPRLRQPVITLFTPWGPRYSWQQRGAEIQPGDAEVETLRKLADLFSEMVANMPGKKWQWLFLGADLYGTRVNKLPADIVAAYFSSLKQWLAELLPTGSLRLWSEFDQAAAAKRLEIQPQLSALVPGRLMQRMRQVAGTGPFVGSAEQYVTERLVEARFIAELYRPIKVSAVGRHKDDFVDEPLPRLYLLPEELHAPWK